MGGGSWKPGGDPERPKDMSEMPYKIEQRDEKFHVIAVGSGKSVASFDTKPEAMEYVKELMNRGGER